MGKILDFIKSFDLTFFVILFVLMFLAVNFQFTQIHEDLHKQVFDNYGVESEVNIGFLGLWGVTEANGTQYRERCNDFCIFQQDLIDVIGYQILIFIFAIFSVSIIFTMIFFYLRLKGGIDT